MSKFPHCTNASFAVGTPRLHYFNRETNTQVQDYLRNAISLKEYAIKHYAAPTPIACQSSCLQLGRSLGRWLRSFHGWAAQPDNEELRTVVSRTKVMQSLKHSTNYGLFPGRVEKYPDILGEVEETLRRVSDMAAREVEDESKLQVIHGDFWTGNILLPDEVIGAHTPVRIVDWEMAQLGVLALDIGQCTAEMWQLKLYKAIDAGEWLIRGLAEGYGNLDADFAFRAIIHVGTHLIGFGSSVEGWGSREQQVQMVRTGKEILVKAWEKDREWFVGHPLECLFGQSS